MKNIENLPHQSGIYMVENLQNNHKYIGQAKDIKNRFLSHHLCEYNNSNGCCYNTKFYQALRKYGIDNFKVVVLELCPIEQLDEREIYYIQKYDTFKNGYNSTIGGQNWSENIHSAETEQKRAETREKNKSLKAENHPRAKLTNQQVWDIRQRYKDGESPESIYQDFKDLYSNLAVFRHIILGESYVSVGNIPTKEEIRHTNGKLTPDQVRKIRELGQQGLNYSQIAKDFPVGCSSIRSILQGKTYTHIK